MRGSILEQALRQVDVLWPVASLPADACLPRLACREALLQTGSRRIRGLQPANGQSLRARLSEKRRQHFQQLIRFVVFVAAVVHQEDVVGCGSG